ncbi:MAG: Lrp/AsnC family transcriptional regulator [Nanoarchaeota archaeon]|nr:Lrp/AsnC family transcriptional regulator [DPANN group archaeon]MBL7116761.1 Lrp/AsnC family transcriptional regulator [Nanoarchaeota archaeon]
MTYEIDEKDLKIIEVLKEHGDYTTRQIAKKTLIPATTINNRIRKLKKKKIIKNFTIELDHSRIGKGFLVYILISANLILLKEKKRTQHDLANDLKKFDFVEKVDIVSGGTDIIVTVRVKDVEEFDQALLGKIQLIEGVDKTQSLIVIH